tara:strand:- start:78 stop:1421 length:1344 start_codon:yes stop_codon:yes gene_type:complete
MKIKKYIIIFFSLFLVISFFSIWTVISGGYDKQNKIILFLKKGIPSSFSRKVRDILFIIPDLKTQNKILNLQVEKFEQGYDGTLFQEKEVKSLEKIYTYKKFFLPFPRLDLRAGYAATKNSTRAHYLEVIKDKVLVISGLGQTIFFEKKNIFNNKLNQIEIPNNIKDEILDKNNYKLIGIRDLFHEKNYLYISLLFESTDGISQNLYRAKLDYNKLNFKLFFETKEYWKEVNVFSGGRIEKFKDNKILYSIGYSYVKGAAQDKNSLLGKIISINTKTGSHELVSIGHRNPQGLTYIDNLNLIINTEHGPKGGDEINFNYYTKQTIPNYGWDVASYGVPYSGKDIYKKSHKDYGFVEPFKNFNPSIGISEIIFLNKDISPSKKDTLFVSSLRAGSIYEIELDNNLSKITKESRFNFGEERIRDIEYDNELNVIFILFSFTPSIGVLKL